MATITPLIFNLPADFSGNILQSAITDDGMYLAVTRNASSGPDLWVFKRDGDTFNPIFSEDTPDLYGASGVAWDPTGEAFFVQCNRSSGRARHDTPPSLN